MIASRIPLFKVVGALKVATARVRTKQAINAVLARVPVSDWQLRDAIWDIAHEADWQGFSRGIFSSKAIGDMQ